MYIKEATAIMKKDIN